MPKLTKDQTEKLELGEKLFQFKPKKSSIVDWDFELLQVASLIDRITLAKRKNVGVLVCEYRLKGRKYLDNKRIDYTPSFDLTKQNDLIKFITAHDDLINALKSEAYSQVFKILRSNLNKKKSFKELFSEKVSLIYSKQATINESASDLLAFAKSINANPEISHAKGLVSIKELLENYRRVRLSKYIDEKFPPSIYLNEFKNEFIKNGKGTIKIDSTSSLKRHTERKQRFYYKRTDLCEKYYNSLPSDESKDVADRRYDSAGQIWRGIQSFIDYCDSNKINDVLNLTPQNLQNWLDYLGDNFTARTIQDYKREVNSGLKSFSKKMRIFENKTVNPFDGVDIIKSTKFEINKNKNSIKKSLLDKVISPKKLIQIVKILHEELTNEKKEPNKYNKTMYFYAFLLNVCLGIRGGEISQIKKLKGDVLSISGSKTENADRYFPFVPETVKKTLEMEVKDRSGSKCKIVNMLEKLPDAKKLSQYLKRLKSDHNLIDFHLTTHMCRHTYISYELYCNDADEKFRHELRLRTGHNSVEVQNIYTNLGSFYTSDLEKHEIQAIWDWVKNDCLDEINRENFDGKIILDHGDIDV